MTRLPKQAMEEQAEVEEVEEQVERVEQVEQVEGAALQLDELVEEEQVWACGHCPKTYHTRRQVYDHWRTSHKDPGTCAACGKHFASHKLLQKHTKSVHDGSVSHVCEVCGLGFTEKAKLTRHARVCGVPGLAVRSSSLLSLDQCALCEMRFSRPGNLHRHVVRVHKVLLRGGGPSFLQRVRSRRARRAAIALTCNICSDAFTQLAELQLHTRRKHPVRARATVARRQQEAPEDIQPCEHCPTICRTGKDLRKHMLADHKGEKVWACSLCDKAYKSPGALKDHRYRHHGGGARLLTCLQGPGHGGCGKVFRHNDSLKKHKKVCGRFTGKPFNQLKPSQRRRRVAARLDRFQQELAGLDDEEREQFLITLARDSVINPFGIEDILSVSFIDFFFFKHNVISAAGPGQPSVRPRAADHAAAPEEALAGRHPPQHPGGTPGQEATPGLDF